MPKVSPKGHGGIYQVKETLCAKIRRQERESCLKRKQHSVAEPPRTKWQAMRPDLVLRRDQVMKGQLPSWHLSCYPRLGLTETNPGARECCYGAGCSRWRVSHVPTHVSPGASGPLGPSQPARGRRPRQWLGSFRILLTAAPSTTWILGHMCTHTYDRNQHFAK